MATFLKTSKMSPALAARVEASVRGARPAPGHSLAPRSISILRLGLLVVIVSLGSWLALFRHRTQQRVEQGRASLVARVRQESSHLTEAEKALNNRVESVMRRVAGDYPGDEVDEAMRGSLAFSTTLARPMLYVRGPLLGFAHSEKLLEAASTSFKDAFLLCLLDPPMARTEKAFLGRARDALAGGGRASGARHVARLLPALVGLPFLTLAWESRVLATDTELELEKLRARFERAPIAEARRAAKAELLLFVMDEPNDGSGPTELDGACPHHVRVGLTDLKTDRRLLLLRRHVDPDWITPAVRAEHASGIDGCRLATELRDELTALSPAN